MAKAYLTPEGMRKRCCRCLAQKQLHQFHKCNRASDGLNPRCAPCQAAAVRQCFDAKLAKGLPIVSIVQAKAALERKRRYYKANPEKHRLLSASNRKNNPVKTQASSKASRAKRPEATRAYANNYYRENSEILKPRGAAQTMKHNAAKVAGMPTWASKAAIQLVYVEAARLTASTGVLHQVDHIVPIVSKTVCGFHVENNLQILTKTENIKKGNRHWPDQP